MPLILPGNVATATAAVGYDIANSCRFNDGDSPQMTLTPGSAGDQDKFTLSFWIKRCALGTAQTVCSVHVSDATTYSYIRFNTDDQLDFTNFLDGGINGVRITDRRFRDISAWYHIVCIWDSGNATGGDRLKVYVNGIQETVFATSNTPNQDVNSSFSRATEMQIGSWNDGAYLDAYLAEMFMCNGQANAASTFGEFNGDSPSIWQPIDCSGDLTFGTNGFYLDFEDSSNLGNDANGGTDFAEVNIAATDQATDSPTNSFATLNPLWRSRWDNDGLISEGNCKITFTAANGDLGYGVSSMGVTGGKWYWEIKIPTVARAGTGAGDATAAAGFDSNFGDHNPSYFFMVYTNGTIQENTDTTSYANSLSDDDIVMYALDMDNHRIWYGINGTWQDSGDPTSGATGTGDITTQISDQSHLNTGEFIFPFCGDPSGSGQSAFEWNFGGCSAFTISSAANDGNGYGNFEYTPPSGFLALCTKNLGSSGG